MKVIKQPLLYVSIISLVLSIIVAVFSTSVKPSSMVMSKVEKALNQKDDNLMSECMQSGREVGDSAGLQIAESLFGIDNWEILVGEASDNGKVNGEDETVTLPYVVVMKADDEVMDISADDVRIITVNGTEYIFEGN